MAVGLCESIILWLKYNKKNIAGVLLTIAIFLPIVIYYSFDVPDSPGEDVFGEVIDRSMHTATEYELPGLIVRVRLESGEIVDIGIPDQGSAEVGDTVIVSKSSSVLTGGALYEYRGIRR